jgi:hypothetical protein
MTKTITLKNLVKLNIKRSGHNHEVQYEPSAMVILNILNYSKALSVRKTNCLGIIDIVLN